MRNHCYGIEFGAKYMSAARLAEWSFARGKRVSSIYIPFADRDYDSNAILVESLSEKNTA